MQLYRVDALPEGALAAAAQFHAAELPKLQDALASGDHLVLVFAPADYTHRAWRLAAVQQLARDHAPGRVNALASDDEAAIAAAVRYIETAEGLTGQYLPLDGNGAGSVLSSAT
jgi:hypothetical protein